MKLPTQVLSRRGMRVTRALAALVLFGQCDRAPADPARGAELPAESLLANGDFESPPGQPPAGWPKPSANVIYEIEDGNRFLRLLGNDPEHMVMAYRAIPVKPELRALELSFRVRYENIKRGKQVWHDGRFMVNLKDTDGKVVAQPGAPNFHGTKQEWQTRTIRFLVPETAALLELMPTLFQVARGTMDIDDVRVIPIDPAVIEAETLARAKIARTKVRRQPGESLIANGDFETDKNGDGLADGWLGKNTDNVSCEEEDGNHFLRLRITEPGKMVHVYKLLPLAADDNALELTFRARYTDIKPGDQPWYDGRIMMNFKLVDGKKVGGPAPYFRGTSDGWRTVTRQFLVPDKAVTIEFMPALFMAKRGTLDLDDFHLTPMTDAQTEAMMAEKTTADSKRTEKEAVIGKDLAMPAITPEVRVSGNLLITARDEQPVWLQGLSVDSMQWGPGESILWSVRVALNEWHANVIRLAVKDSYWFGRAESGVTGGNVDSYRTTVDQAVQLCAAKGAYLILDLHRFRAPTADHIEFWKDAATRYKNNPAVLFELFNEPHDISWEIWRNGGQVTDKIKPEEGVVAENQEKLRSFQAVGMQQLVEAVRSTGARNVVLASGLSWSYDLTGALKGYALDDPSGNGIMYVWHNYPWKKGWQTNGLDVAEKYPVILTEVGAIRAWEDFSFIGPSERYPLEGWAEDMLGLIQKHKLHWTGFSFHPRCGPMVIEDWDYTPTPYWGVYVKDALAGKQFQMKKMR